LLRRWRSRRLSQPGAAPSAAAEALARRGRRRRRGAGLAAAVEALSRRPGRLLPALLGAAVIFTLGAVAASGADRIRGAEVSGQRRVSAGAIYAASGLEGARVLGLDTAAAERRVAALAGIRRARVQVGLPARARIAVEEVPLALLWRNGAGLFAVDEDGLAGAPPADASGLVPVEDLAGAIARPGDRVEAALVAAAVAFAARFGPLTYRAETGFSATSREGFALRLGTDASQAARAEALLLALAPELARQAGDVDYVDLRFLDRPYYRLRGGTE
jgi:cell division septal protein FtsQ